MVVCRECRFPIRRRPGGREMPSMKVHKLARDLWPVLINQAGLDVPNRWPRLWRKDQEEHSYDAGLLQELNSALFPGSTASFAKSLKDANPPIPAETLLRAFFK